MTSAITFRLARMSPLVRTLTILLLGLPVGFLVTVLLGRHQLAIPTLFLVTIYACVWPRFRPNEFVVHRGALEIIWPLMRREILREDITDVRIIDRQTLRKEIGRGIRVGAGGLLGRVRMVMDQEAGYRADVRFTN